MDEKSSFFVKIATIIAAAGVSWGIIYTKVETLRMDVGDLKRDVADVRESTASLNSKVDSLLRKNNVDVSQR